MTSRKLATAAFVVREFCFIAVSLLLLIVPIRALAQTLAKAEQTADHPICRLIDSAALANGLPTDFFARVIWQESRFQPDVIGPLTHSGEHAEGIAQFMPGTAAEMGLYEPFDPVEALPRSGELLAELRAEFGNLGLAAAAYNAGSGRVRNFLAGFRDLPLETRNYVLAITGRPVEDWANAIKGGSAAATNGEPQPAPSSTDCRHLMAELERAPNPFVTEWNGHKVPSWCRDLHHPSISVCGPVHSLEPATKTVKSVEPRSHVHLMKTSAR